MNKNEVCACSWVGGDWGLVVSLPFDPVAPGQCPEQELPGLIIAEDEHREGDGREPPSELQWVHPKTFVHAWSIAQEGSQAGLKDKTKVQEPVLHALLEYRVHSGLANDEISPLDNDNGHKEGSVASVLKNLSVPVGPFLTIGIFQIVDSLGIP